MKGSGIYIMLTERITLQGQPIAQVARETGLSRNTIKRYLREGEQPHKSKGKKHGSKLDSFTEQIDVLIGNGIYNCQVILERIQTLGYLGGISVPGLIRWLTPADRDGDGQFLIGWKWSIFSRRPWSFFVRR